MRFRLKSYTQCHFGIASQLPKSAYMGYSLISIHLYPEAS